jgi:hypothetical protein
MRCRTPRHEFANACKVFLNACADELRRQHVSPVYKSNREGSVVWKTRQGRVGTINLGPYDYELKLPRVTLNCRAVWCRGRLWTPDDSGVFEHRPPGETMPRTECTVHVTELPLIARPLIRRTLTGDRFPGYVWSRLATTTNRHWGGPPPVDGFYPEWVEEMKEEGSLPTREAVA